MKTYDSVADAAGLENPQRERYIAYMRARWADDEEVKCAVGYALEWAYRFKYGEEYTASDSEGQATLRHIDLIIFLMEGGLK
jgi:hypothetical protein